MPIGAGWPDVALALISFAREDPIKFFCTVPLTGIVILVGTFLFFGVVVIRPITMLAGQYEQRRRQHRPGELPLE
jgi:hypothetical protein